MTKKQQQETYLENASNATSRFEEEYNLEMLSELLGE